LGLFAFDLSGPIDANHLELAEVVGQKSHLTDILDLTGVT